MENTYTVEKLEADVINELIKVRKSRKLTQNDLSKICGLCQPVIARVELCHVHTTLRTIIKILMPLNKTLKIVDIEPRK